MRVFIVFLVVFFAFPAQAIEVSYAESMCRILGQHTPRDDVTYQPGITIKGQRVAPADLEGGGIFHLEKNIKIPLSLDLAERFGLQGFANRELTASMGTIEITKDGRVLKDGKDLTGKAQIICGNREGSGQKR